ncbi:MAG: Hsp20/alpha crystallin family protein [Isosphaeraceae bacterium]
MNSMTWTRRWDPFRELQREMGRLFDSFDPSTGRSAAWQFPPVNVYDVGDHYVLTVPLPGTSPDDFELTITGETLTLRGERKRPEGVADESYRRQERFFGRWSRTLTLPDRIESPQVAASYAQGILTVTLPKAESARPRQISVNVTG